MPNVDQVARWMVEQVKKDGFLYQQTAVYSIFEIFGEEFTYTNQLGNLAIQKSVLDKFRKLTEQTIVWMRRDRCWRPREDFDSPGREQP